MGNPRKKAIRLSCCVFLFPICHFFFFGVSTTMISYLSSQFNSLTRQRKEEEAACAPSVADIRINGARISDWINGRAKCSLTPGSVGHSAKALLRPAKPTVRKMAPPSRVPGTWRRNVLRRFFSHSDSVQEAARDLFDPEAADRFQERRRGSITGPRSEASGLQSLPPIAQIKAIPRDIRATPGFTTKPAALFAASRWRHGNGSLQSKPCMGCTRRFSAFCVLEKTPATLDEQSRPKLPPRTGQ